MNSSGPGKQHYLAAINNMVTDLPLLPSVVSQLLVLSPDDDRFLDEVYHLARQDPTFSIRLVQYAARTCRSSQMAEKFSLKHAIARLGSRQIAGIVASLSLMDSFEPNNQSDRNLWVHSVQVAVIARKLIEVMPDLHLDSEIIYLGALLHDIGRFVIFQAVPQGPARIDESHWMTPTELLDAEVNICGVDHVRVGAEACARWDIPKAISDIVANHHNYHLPLDTLDERLLCTRVGVTQIADFYSVSLMNQAVEEVIEAGVDEMEPAGNGEERLTEALAEALDEIISANGSVLPEKYRAIIPHTLIMQRQQIVSETGTILDALGIPEETDGAIMRHD
ncbi:HDOD domain-containing protein [Sedimenticola hydrogenitrophicus]|uniref:HDOD domain-containing protein n=1 Tax=Sedimenticola hydrogenitrophicus TaxID=2967975 RepID=UPI0021A96A3D|nr:HDOD domain-containing protein [Sedimenticola hydrogenitrophicus]